MRMVARSEDPWRRVPIATRGGTERVAGRERGALRAQRKDASGDVIAIDALRSVHRHHYALGAL